MDNVKNMLNIFFGKLRLEGGLAWFKKNRIRVLKAFVVAIFVILVIKFIIINIAGIKFLIGFLMLGIICGGLSSRR
jgi:type IV secretory pathway TrbL component